MFIVCNQKEADKKSVKQFHKIIISEHLESIPDSKKISHMNQFLPPMQLFHDFCNGDINQKKYFKKYCKNIRENEQLYASIVLLMLAYEKTKNLVLVCSSEEMKYGYMNFFASILQDDFGVEVFSYPKWKENGCKEKCKFDSKALKKAVKEYRYILDDDYDDDYKSKKKGKKKSNKKHGPTTLSDLDKSNKKKKDKKKVTKKAPKRVADLTGFVSANRKPKEPVIVDGFLMDTMRVIHVTKIK